MVEGELVPVLCVHCVEALLGAPFVEAGRGWLVALWVVALWMAEGARFRVCEEVCFPQPPPLLVLPG